MLLKSQTKKTNKKQTLTQQKGYEKRLISFITSHEIIKKESSEQLPLRDCMLNLYILTSLQSARCSTLMKYMK